VGIGPVSLLFHGHGWGIDPDACYLPGWYPDFWPTVGSLVLVLILGGGMVFGVVRGLLPKKRHGCQRESGLSPGLVRLLPVGASLHARMVVFRHLLRSAHVGPRHCRRALRHRVEHVDVGQTPMSRPRRVMTGPKTIVLVSGDPGSRPMSAILGLGRALAFAGGSGVSIVRIGNSGGNESLVHPRLVHSL